MTTETTKPELVDLLDDNFEDMVRGIANRYARSRANANSPLINADDLYSEGILASIKAYEKFDPCRNVAFRTYAYVYITRAMWDYCKRYRFILSSSTTDRRDRFDEVKNASSGVVNVDQIDVAYQPSDQHGIDLNEYFLAGLDKVRRGIIVDRFISNLTLQELAVKYNMSTSGVNNTIQYLRDKLTSRARRYDKID